MDRSNGFTLVEMLFVLFVISIFTILFIPNFVKTIEKQQTAQFFDLFSSDIFYIQNQTLNTNESYRIWLRDDHYLIISNDTMKRRNYPKHLEFTSYSNTRISFSKAGTVINPTTLRFKDRYHSYCVVFPFGKGRHYIEVD